MLNFPEPSINEFFSTFDIKGFAVREDEQQLVLCCSMNGVYQLWSLDPESPFPVQLTSENHRSDAIVIHEGSHGGQPFILYTGDTGGDENMQIYAIPLVGGSPTGVRIEEGKRHFFGYLSGDGQRLYYSSNKESSMYLTTYCFNLDTGEEKVIMEGAGAATYLGRQIPAKRCLYTPRCMDGRISQFLFKKITKLSPQLQKKVLSILLIKRILSMTTACIF